MLSKNQLNAIHIPIVKDFCFKETDKEDFAELKKSMASVKSSVLSKDLDNSSCCTK